MHRDVNLIVIHCSASEDGKPLAHGSANHLPVVTAAEVIDGWHQARGFHRGDEARELLNPHLKSIGYHFVIDTGGSIESGRHLDEVGAHVLGHNARSVGICMVGKDRFTAAQWSALKSLVTFMRGKYPTADVCGHRDLSPDVNGDGIIEPWEWLKTCPGFSVATWLARGREPQPENVFPPPVKAPL